jgi:5-oxoprolinase (ATP-hydrolysing)
VTDCNVMLGRLQPDHFPAVFGPGQDQPLDRARVVEQFTTLVGEIAASGAAAPTPAGLAERFLRIAVEHMAQAIKTISVQRGHDVAGYALVCFGGAGGQHACAVADALNMREVVLHPLAGVLSAYGMGIAEVRALREQSVERPLASLPGEPPVETTLEQCIASLRAAALAELEEQGLGAAGVDVTASVHLRYQGSDTALEVPFAPVPEMEAAFRERYRERFGFLLEDRPLVAATCAVEPRPSPVGAKPRRWRNPSWMRCCGIPSRWSTSRRCSRGTRAGCRCTGANRCGSGTGWPGPRS